MISKSILDFCIYLINKIVGFTGLPLDPVSSDIQACFLVVKDVFGRGVPLVSWLFPSETLYLLAINLTIDLITATLVFEVVALFLRIYGNFRK